MQNLGRFEFRRIQAFVLEHLIAFHCASADPRWTLLALVARALTSASELARRRLAALIRAAPRRAARLARLAPVIAAADTTVAAGGR